jgi:glyoxylase-like metal-dependent hydrolase (beta-lactamase superfamily II)
LFLKKATAMKILVPIFLLLGLWSCQLKPTPEYRSNNFEIHQLAEGVFACIHKFGGKAICNTGIIDNGRETLVFDTFLSPEVAEEIQQVVDHYGLSPLRYVVNSHAHNDHIRGNQVFSTEVDIISTSRCAELIAEWEKEEIPAEKAYAPPLVAQYDSLLQHFHGDTTGREYKNILMWLPYFETLAESHLKVRTRLPNLIMEDSLSLDGPERRIRLLTQGAGHTESDVILYLPDDRVLFTADLVFNEMHPYMGHGFPQEWITYLDYIETLNFDTLVPGHGELCGRKQITAMKSYIRDMERLALEMHQEDMTMEQLSEIRMPDAYLDWWFENFFTSNLRFMYHHLGDSNQITIGSIRP